MSQLVPDIAQNTFQPVTTLELPHALAHADALLHCAAAVAYESADQHKGHARQLALSVVHLVDLARTLVVHGLDTETRTAHAKAAEAND